MKRKILFSLGLLATVLTTTFGSGNVVQAATHSHNYQPVYTTIHHDAVTHTEEQVVGTEQRLVTPETTTEKVDNTRAWIKCSCGFYTECSQDDRQAVWHNHILAHVTGALPPSGGGITSGNCTTTITVPAVYETVNVYDTVTVVDKEAYDEQVITGYQCSCGATKGGTQGAWKSTSSGWFYSVGSGYIANTWSLINGKWYAFDENGYMRTGWFNDGGTWYYFKSSGEMATGWVLDGNTWYYMNGSGAMQTGWVKDGSNWYYMNQSGAMQTGWVNDGGTWYYLYSSGAMACNTTIDGYHLNASGAWVQ